MKEWECPIQDKIKKGNNKTFIKYQTIEVAIQCICCLAYLHLVRLSIEVNNCNYFLWNNLLIMLIKFELF